MGVSADRSSALSTAVQLFSLLSLPISPEELDRDMTRLNRYSHELVPKLFERYDRTKAPYPENGGPVEIVSYLMVDHIEELNQFQQTLTFHGTLILNWLDARLAWEPQDFGSLDRLSFTGFDLGRFWSPGVTVKGVTMPVRNLAMFHNTAYTLMSTGHIFAEMSVSLKAACRLDLATYPNDNQTCFVMVFTPLYSTAKVTFTASSSLMGRHSMFSESGQTTMASGFELDDLNAQRFFAYAKGFTTNQSEADLYSSLTNTVLRYQICLRRRDNGMYTAAVALPLFCLSVMAFTTFFVPSVRLSLLWLLACILLLLMHNQRMAQFLPQDFDSEPLCVRLARLLLLQLVALLVIRLWFAFQQKTSVNGSTSSKLPAADGAAILPQFLVDGGGGYQSPSQIWTRRLHGIMRWALMAETVMLFFWLFL